MRMKSKLEIGQYLLSKIQEKGMSQSDLARLIAETRGDGFDKNSVKDNVSKWIRGERYPGTEYIYYLAQVLEVSIEEILVAGEVCNKYEDRPFTLYAVAKSGNRAAVDKIMSLYTDENSGCCVGTNYDEYDKTFLDYIIQFENLDLLHYLIEQGRLSFYDSQISTDIRLGNSYSDTFKQIVEFAVKYDDLKLFSKAVKRTRPILLNKSEKIDESALFTLGEYRAGYQLSKEIIIKILGTKDILNYLITPFVPSVEEWRQLNAGIEYIKPRTREERIEVKSFQTISQSFNLLMNIALQENHSSVQKIISIAKNHNGIAQNQLATIYSINDWKVGSEGNVTVGRYEIGSLTVLAGISSSLYKESQHGGLLKL